MIRYFKKVHYRRDLLEIKKKHTASGSNSLRETKKFKKDLYKAIGFRSHFK